MKQDSYRNVMDHINISENFYIETARKMKAIRKKTTSRNNLTTTMPIRKAAFAFAGAAVFLGAGFIAFQGSNILKPGAGINQSSQGGITVPEVTLPGGDQGVKARMRPLFVYQGRVYIQYNTSIAANEDGTISEATVQQLRGDYLGTTTSGINELSGQEDYTADFASNIGEGDVYTVKCYDSKYRLMVYSEYEGGFTCEIYDSFGGLTLNSGADYFDILKLKDHITSYQWESFDSWNNGGLDRTDAVPDKSFDQFINQLYEATPVEGSVDLLIEDTSADSQKFIYLKTKDDLVVTLRLLKDGYVYAPEIGFFQMDQVVFDEFYHSLQ